jgi:hypothetical protein
MLKGDLLLVSACFCYAFNTNQITNLVNENGGDDKFNLIQMMGTMGL